MAKADANVSIGADGSAFTKTVKDIQKDTDTLANSITARLARIGGALNTVSMVGSAIGGAVSSLGGMAKAVIEPAAAAERLSLSFEVMLGSETEALNFMEKLQEYAAKTPFEMQGISEAAKTLLAMTSLSGGEAVGVIEQLGNIAAATGGNLNDLARIYAKAFNMGVTNEVAESFAIAGFDIRNILADIQGVSFEEVKQQISRAEIGFEGLAGALAVYTGEGGKLHGMTEKLSGTFEGLASTLGDNVTLSLQTVGASLLPYAKEAVEKLVQALDAAKPSLAVLSDMFGKWFGDNVAGNVLPALDELVLRIPELGWHLKNLAEDVGEWFESVTAVPREIGKAFSNFDAFLTEWEFRLGGMEEKKASLLAQKIHGSYESEDELQKKRDREAELAAIQERTRAMIAESQARVEARRQEAAARDAAREEERKANAEKQEALKKENAARLEAERQERIARKEALKDEERRKKLAEERVKAARDYAAARGGELVENAARALELMGRSEEAQTLRDDLAEQRRADEYRKRGATDDEATLRAGLDRMLDTAEREAQKTQQSASRQWIHTGVSAVGGGGSVIRFGGQDASLKESQKQTQVLRDVLETLRGISNKTSPLQTIPVVA